MTLDEVRRSLATGMRIEGELAQALDAAGISYPVSLQTEGQVEELQAAIAAARKPTTVVIKDPPKSPRGTYKDGEDPK